MERSTPSGCKWVWCEKVSTRGVAVRTNDTPVGIVQILFLPDKYGKMKDGPRSNITCLASNQHNTWVRADIYKKMVKLAEAEWRRFIANPKQTVLPL